MTLPLAKLLRLLLWLQWRRLVAQVRGVREQSRLLLTVLSSFVLGYVVVGYFLFYKGLSYIYTFPVVGPLLSHRVLYLIFGFFFVMLIVSNMIAGYATLFRNRETAWFLTLPIPHRYVYLWKFIQTVTTSSWALVFLSAPLMAAYGRVHDAPLAFYLQVTLLYLPFIAIPAVIGSWLILLVVRVLSRPWVKRALIGISVVLLLLMVFALRPTSEQESVSSEDVVSFERLFKHTRLTLHPALPSVWVARSIVALIQRLNSEATFYFLLLSANAAFGLLIAYLVGAKFFYPSWTYAASSRTLRFNRKKQAQQESSQAPPSLLERLFSRMTLLSRPTRALILKDFKIFWRDPSQWTQFAVFFGLLLIYVLNLRNIAYDFDNPFWSTVISFLNLGACSLTLSTLTTRFVFPQFSLEGRRLWIIGLAPIGLDKVVRQKFWTAFLCSTLITVTLILTSSITLNYPASKVLFFVTAITLMSASLSGLSVGMGALFPNLKADNPATVVSGFGGTLCLVVSFVYIILFIACTALPTGLDLVDAPTSAGRTLLIKVLSYSGAVGLSAATTLIPLHLAYRKVKTLEF